MSRPGKRFEQHSVRWQREARRDGISPKRWNAWFKLSARSRKLVGIRPYAHGETVRSVIRAAAELAAAKNFLKVEPSARAQTVRRGIRRMTLAELRWTTKATGDAIRKRAGVKPANGEINNWWYR